MHFGTCPQLLHMRFESKFEKRNVFLELPMELEIKLREA
jgi:hypothetical protein